MNGILNFLKPPGMTSHDAVAVIRRLTKIKRIGHTGTLDPGASGVLPVCVGQATRVAEYVLEMNKSYRAELTLGTATDTEDAAGNVIESKCVASYTEEEIKNVLSSFQGKRMQVPPMYSAVRIAGEKLYERARRGETVERPARPIRIYNIDLCWVKDNRIMFDVTCSRGTYVRTLCREIAEKLGTVGHMSFLLRTCVGPFVLIDALTFEECSLLLAQGELSSHLAPPDTALSHLPFLEVSQQDALRVKNGVPLKAAETVQDGEMLRVYGPGREFLAVSRIEAGYMRPLKVFN